MDQDRIETWPNWKLERIETKDTGTGRLDVYFFLFSFLIYFLLLFIFI